MCFHYRWSRIHFPYLRSWLWLRSTTCFQYHCWRILCLDSRWWLWLRTHSSSNHCWWRIRYSGWCTRSLGSSSFGTRCRILAFSPTDSCRWTTSNSSGADQSTRCSFARSESEEKAPSSFGCLGFGSAEFDSGADKFAPGAANTPGAVNTEDVRRCRWVDGSCRCLRRRGQRRSRQPNLLPTSRRAPRRFVADSESGSSFHCSPWFVMNRAKSIEVART